MTDPKDPSRLLEGQDVPEGLRNVLRAAEADVGSDQQVARLASRLGPLLLGPAVPVATGAATAATASGALKLGLATLAIIGAGGGAWLLSAPQSASPPAPTKPALVAPTPVVAPAPATPVAAAPSEAAPSEPAADNKAASPAPAAHLPSKPTPPAAPSEADLLEQARSSLKSDPARALARANEAASRYPRGVLVQEREVLAIQALRRLGRSAEADRRAEAFAKAFPGSAFQRKLNAAP
jgi:hypothetical protein